MKINDYFLKLDEGTLKAMTLANKARSKGYDPEDKVEIPLTKNLAERVEGLISVVSPQILGSGVVQRITELEKQYSQQDWKVALTIALEVA